MLFVIVAVLFPSLSDPLLAQAKVQKCSNLISGGQDFFFCSKFAVAKGKRLEVDVIVKFKRSLLSKSVDSSRDTAWITVGVYNHQQWQKRDLQVGNVNKKVHEICRAQKCVGGLFEFESFESNERLPHY